MGSLSLWVGFALFFSPMIFSAENAAPAAGAESALLEDKDYKEKSLKLLGLEARLKDMNDQLLQMIELKKREKDSDKSRELMKELVTKTAERNKAVTEHRQLKSFLLYRYPNLGELIHKKYGTHEEATIEQLEKARGLDELLTETKALIDKKYAPFTKKSEQDLETKPKPKNEPLKIVK